MVYEFDELRKKIYLYEGRRLLAEENILKDYNLACQMIDTVISEKTGVPIEITPKDILPAHVRASLPFLFYFGYWLGKTGSLINNEKGEDLC